MKETKVLIKKIVRDFLWNIKQFISIIFIIAVSVTLFVGLEANSTSIAKRVDEVYSCSNMASLFVTFNPSFMDFDENNKDLENIENIVKEEVDNNSDYIVEKRLYLPSKIADKSTYSLIYDNHFPLLSYPYELTLNNNHGLKPVKEVEEDIKNIDLSKMFIVDTNLLNYFSIKDDHEYKIGDNLTVSYDVSMLDSLFNSSLDTIDEETINNKIIETLDSSDDISESYKSILKGMIEREPSLFKNSLPSIFDLIFKDTNNINVGFTISGIMKHPENIENSTFSASSMIFSSQYFYNELFTYLFDNKITQEVVVNIISTLEETSEDSTNQLFLGLAKNLFSNMSEVEFKNKYVTPQKEDILTDLNDPNDNKLKSDLSSIFNSILLKTDDEYVDDIKVGISEYFINKENNNLIFNSKSDELPSSIVLSNDIDQSTRLTYVFPFIFIIVGILVSLTTITSIILKQRVEIGLMKALGIEKHKIYLYYACFFSLIALIGILLGFIVGPLLIPFIMNIKYEILYSLPALGYVFPIVNALILTVTIIALIALITFIVIYKELRLNPAEGIRNKAPKINIKVKENKESKLNHVSLKMALRNIRVFKSRSFMVIVGVLGCVGLLLSGFGIDDVIDYGKNVDLNNFFNADLTLTYSSNYEYGEVGNEILRKYDDKIKTLEEFSMSTTTLIEDKGTVEETRNDVIYIYIDKDSKFFQYDDNLEFDYLNEVGISEVTANKLGYKVGDEITFTVNNEEITKKVGYIFYSFSLKGIVHYQNDIDNVSVSTSNAFVELYEGFEPNDVKNILLNDTALPFNGILTSKDALDRVDMYVGAVEMMTNTVKAFAIILAVIVLVNLAILNFNERKRDLATLKVLGFSYFEIAKSLIYEIMILVLIGTILGLFIGLPLEYLVLINNITDLVYWKYLIYWESYVFAIALSLLTGLIVNLFVSLKIKKINMCESLKSIEE